MSLRMSLRTWTAIALVTIAALAVFEIHERVGIITALLFPVVLVICMTGCELW